MEGIVCPSGRARARAGEGYCAPQPAAAAFWLLVAIQEVAFRPGVYARPPCGGRQRRDIAEGPSHGVLREETCITRGLQDAPLPASIAFDVVVQGAAARCMNRRRGDP